MLCYRDQNLFCENFLLILPSDRMILIATFLTGSRHLYNCSCYDMSYAKVLNCCGYHYSPRVFVHLLICCYTFLDLSDNEITASLKLNAFLFNLQETNVRNGPK